MTVAEFCVCVSVSQVDDCCFLHSLRTLPPGPASLAPPSDTSRYLLLVSGLEFGSALTGEGQAPPLELSAQMLADFVGGRVGGEHAALVASKIVR
jgi:hypothetical protein